MLYFCSDSIRNRHCALLILFQLITNLVHTNLFLCIAFSYYYSTYYSTYLLLQCAFRSNYGLLGNTMLTFLYCDYKHMGCNPLHYFMNTRLCCTTLFVTQFTKGSFLARVFFRICQRVNIHVRVRWNSVRNCSFATIS